MDTKELRQKTDKELAEITASLQEQLRRFRFEAASEAMKDVREIRESKKTLARALTIISEKAKAARAK